MLAIWDLHGPALPDFNPAISLGLGLPQFVNHIAFEATSLEDLEDKKDRWIAEGHDVVRIDHGWCTSIYANDPGGTMVEFCLTTRAMDDKDRAEAFERLQADVPVVDRVPPPTEFYLAAAAREPVAAPAD